jgi:hypothetical protein
VFNDEGHFTRRRENMVYFARKLEDFLATHLGGRRTGVDFAEAWHTIRALFVAPSREEVKTDEY